LGRLWPHLLQLWSFDHFARECPALKKNPT
jgi:hypothetical protein